MPKKTRKPTLRMWGTIQAQDLTCPPAIPAETAQRPEACQILCLNCSSNLSVGFLVFLGHLQPLLPLSSLIFALYTIHYTLRTVEHNLAYISLAITTETIVRTESFSNIWFAPGVPASGLRPLETKHYNVLQYYEVLQRTTQYYKVLRSTTKDYEQRILATVNGN